MRNTLAASLVVSITFAVGAKKVDAPVLTSLAASVQALKDHFNANKDRVRFVAILSPT